ncbi:MAG: YtxH domain-containing protein [Patescibacteria group bacterium]|jgi:gas vesicle protein
MPDKKKSSHLGAGLLVGAAIGVATAAFLQSKKGKAFTKDLSKKTMALQKKITMELQKSGTLTKESYQNLVDKVVAYYVTTKDIAKNEIPEVTKLLKSHWKNVERELKNVK